MLRGHVFSRWYRSTDCGTSWTLHKGRRIRSLAASGQDSPVVYAIEGAGMKRDLARSEDPGLSWQSVLDGNVGRLAVDLRDDRHIYASGTELQLENQTAEGIAESRDGGQSWRPMSLPFEGASKIWALVPAADGSGELFIGTRDGAWLHRPQTGGQRIFDRQMLVRDILRAPGQPGVIYLCAEGGIFASANEGRTWFELDSDPVDCRRLAVVGGGGALLMITPAQADRYVKHPGWWMTLWGLQKAMDR